ncbi:unnamed protein product [Polarella glacialis]|uniref:PARP catalytic domain-containing protein n=1 Tax=Polarella glacialis TaxID=89957 RepID=A0A813GAN7_POLGL|nr:unnamed protein product [Polarella glacialis]
MGCLQSSGGKEPEELRPRDEEAEGSDEEIPRATSSGYIVPTAVDEVEVVNEEHGAHEVPVESLPAYWTNRRVHGEASGKLCQHFDQMVCVSEAGRQAIRELVRGTYRPLVTQDRPCPKEPACPKTPAGCPCVKPDGTPGLPTEYVVRRVIRVEDSEMWTRYAQKRSQIRERRAHRMPLRGLEPELFTSQVVATNPGSYDSLDTGLNEVYLWHGTHVRTGLAIAQHDFNLEFAGSGAGGMLGSGIYFAESCTKADEYATDEPGGYYEGIFGMLLCRVTMGSMHSTWFYTTQRRADAAEQVESGKFDSTVGDRMKFHNTFREFVVYDSDQVYPEYVVLYSRAYKADDAAALQLEASRNPFHLQLPVYWNNFHANPDSDVFRVQYKVREQTRALLQHLVTGSFLHPAAWFCYYLLYVVVVCLLLLLLFIVLKCCCCLCFIWFLLLFVFYLFIILKCVVVCLC